MLGTAAYLAQVCGESSHLLAPGVLPDLQLVQADVGEASDAGHLLASPPLTQLHRDQLILQLLHKVQHLRHLAHYPLHTFTAGSTRLFYFTVFPKRRTGASWSTTLRPSPVSYSPAPVFEGNPHLEAEL